MKTWKVTSLAGGWVSGIEAENEAEATQKAIEFGAIPTGPYTVSEVVVDPNALDYSKIEDIQVDGIDGRDAPDFIDAFICSASYDGREMTEEELETLNDDSAFVYECVMKQLY